MRITRAHAFIIGAALPFLIYGAYRLMHFLFHLSARDTPIIIAGGSIYGETYNTDTDGWALSSDGTYYTASLHPGQLNQQYGIDNILISNFQTSPNPNPITGSQGWSIHYSNRDGHGHDKADALWFCSNQNCSTSKPCSSSLGDTVYLKLGNHTRFDARMTGNPGVIDEVHFHDKENSCDGAKGSKEGACDYIYSIEVKTCSDQKTQTFICSDPNGLCNVKIGLP